MTLELENGLILGDNDHYAFGVGAMRSAEETRWIGYAVSHVKRPGQIGLYFFPEVSDGCVMGLLNRERAILLTGAIAQDPASCYGGVKRWFVAEHQRGDPEDFRCKRCGDVGCPGDCDSDVFLADD